MADYEILRRPIAGICDRRPRPKEAQLPPLEDRRRREEDMLIRLRELTLCLRCLCPSFPDAERKSRKGCVAKIVSGANLTNSSSATVPSIVLPPRRNKRTSLLYKVGFDELAKKLDMNNKRREERFTAASFRFCLTCARASRSQGGGGGEKWVACQSMQNEIPW